MDQESQIELTEKLEKALDEIRILREEFQSLKYIIESQKNAWLVWRAVIKDALRASNRRHP